MCVCVCRIKAKRVKTNKCTHQNPYCSIVQCLSRMTDMDKCALDDMHERLIDVQTRYWQRPVTTCNLLFSFAQWGCESCIEQAALCWRDLKGFWIRTGGWRGISFLQRIGADRGLGFLAVCTFKTIKTHLAVSVSRTSLSPSSRSPHRLPFPLMLVFPSSPPGEWRGTGSLRRPVTDRL